LYSHSFDTVVPSDWSLYDVARTCIRKHMSCDCYPLLYDITVHVQAARTLKKTILLYCWLHVCCGRCLVMGLHVTVLSLAYILSEDNCNCNFLMQVLCWKPSVATNLSPHYDHILNVISLLLTFFDISFSS
jgi:hypothetical protein